MDYDRTAMPAVYDAGRGYAPDVLARWLEEIARAAGPGPIEAILDLGCGTGRYSGALASRFGAAVVAMDPSEQMLAQARAKAAPGVTYLRGSGEAVPLADSAVDLVFMSMVFHHFAAPDQVARECRRVLRPGGRVVIRAGAAERSGEFAYTPFFPPAKRLIEARLGPIGGVEQTFVGAGFTRTFHAIVMSELASDWADYAGRVALRADSILIQLDDADFAAGLAALHAHAATQPTGQPVAEPVDLLAFRRA